MIAVPWIYDPVPGGYDKFILPFKQAGIQTWVAPSVNNYNKVYPDTLRGFENIGGLMRDGQRLGSTGALNTVWNDDGEGLFNLDWPGVLFGASAAWQPGEMSTSSFRASFGAVFHGDQSGKVDQAIGEFIAIQDLLQNKPHAGDTDRLYWMDPWSADGQAVAKDLRPILHDLRMHAETAVVLLKEARAQGNLREPDALDAMEMAARRLDLIGLKFQLSYEIISQFAAATTAAADPATQLKVDDHLYQIADTNGRMQDIRNGYAEQRALYEHAWNEENRPFSLENIMGKYLIAEHLWISRAQTIEAAMDDWHRTHHLASAEQLGIPVQQQ
jgi:hypothetical protein